MRRRQIRAETQPRGEKRSLWLALLGAVALLALGGPLRGQFAKSPQDSAPSLPGSIQAATPALSISLPPALQLAGVKPIDIALASARLKTALAQEDRSRVLWLP